MEPSPYTLQPTRHPSLQLGGPGLQGSSPRIFQPFAAHSISHCTAKSLPRIAFAAIERGGTGAEEEEGWDFQCLESFLCRDWVGACSLSHALHLCKARDCSPHPPFAGNGCSDRVEDALMKLASASTPCIQDAHKRNAFSRERGQTTLSILPNIPF
jgi:hypothetical protein